MLNNIPQIKVTSNSNEQNLYSVIPNFLMINQPEVKALETKVKKHKRLMVWFDIRNEHNRHDNFDYATTVLEDFSFQLTLRTDKGHYQLKPIGEKEIANLKSLIISRDTDGVVIDNNIFVYEINEEKLNDEIAFEYSLSYKNDQMYGLTYDGIKGSNHGAIMIRNNNAIKNNEVIFNNAFAYLENKPNKTLVVNRDVLNVDRYKINRIISNNNPLLDISVRNEINSVPELSKSKQIRVELGKIIDTGVNYLQSSESTLKMVQKDNHYKAYKTTGNHYDFQTNKWVESINDQTYCFDATKLKLSFEYNYQKFDLDLNIKNNDFQIKRTNSSNKNLRLISSYKNVKPNTKFNTFINSRNAK